MPGLEDAILLSVQAHKGQKDKAGQPYILHPLRVMFRLENETDRIVAILHDVIEDTPHTLEELKTLGYSEEIREALDCLTRRESETYQEFIKRLLPNSIARRVKLSDLEDNMDIRRLSTFREKDSKRLSRYLEAWKELRSTS